MPVVENALISESYTGNCRPWNRRGRQQNAGEKLDSGSWNFWERLLITGTSTRDGRVQAGFCCHARQELGKEESTGMVGGHWRREQPKASP